MKHSQAKTPMQGRAKEGLIAWLIAAALLAVAHVAGNALPWLDANLAFVAALIFILVPGYFLRKRGEHESSYGLAFDDWRKGLGWGLGFTLVTVLLFSPAYHLWETRVEQRTAHLSAQNYRQLDMAWYGAPQRFREGKVHVWTWGQQTYVAWTPQHAEGALELAVQEPGMIFSTAEAFRAGSGPNRLAFEVDRAQQVFVKLHAHDAKSLRITGHDGDVAIGPHDVLAGAAAQPEGQGVADETHIPLGYGWLFHLMLTHLILVAVPEEFFFRGYLQERLHQAWGRKGVRVFGLPLTWAIVVSSLLFALVHLISTVQLTRLSVFFPSLLFGALRERTGGISASIVYHAACNMLVILLSVHYY